MIQTTGSDYLLDAILEYCDDIITVKDLDFKYIAFNKAFLKHIDVEKGNEVVGKSVDAFFCPADCDILLNNLKKVVKNFKPYCSTFVYVKNGVSKIVKQTITPIIKNGVVQSILTVSSDVTNEENLKTKLLDKNYQLNTLLENLPFFVFLKDKEKKLVVATKDSKNFLENGIDKFSNGLQIDVKQSLPETNNEDNYVLQNKKSLKKEKSVLDNKGNLHWYRVHKSPILTSSNEVNGILTISQNIDKEKQLETQKNLFLATISHDLKNPLLSQICSLEMLYKQLISKLNEEQKEIFELVVDSSKFMKSMLYSLLKTCKESDGVIQLERKNFDMQNVVKHSVKEISSLAANRNIKLSVDTHSDTNVIYADENQMRRVVGNLLNNAASYAFENSEIKISLFSLNNKFTMNIENKSNEISDKLKKHIFDKYVCGDNIGNCQTGLGLYFCRKIVEAHDGKIHLFNNKNLNKFEIEIPILDEKSALCSQVVL